MGNKKTIDAADTTIFDDTYQTMIQKMPSLIIPVINEVFGTDYSEAEDLKGLRNEHLKIGGKVITDSLFSIRDRYYHIECQSTPDGTMALRMIDYDFAIAIEKAYNEDAPYEVSFPQSCVLYLRHNRNTPDHLEVIVRFPDGTAVPYRTRVIKVQQYTRDEIFRKRLLLFLPFYIMRYEQKEKLSSDRDLLRTLLEEYEGIRSRLHETLGLEQKEALYHDLVNVITRITDYVFRNDDETRKEVAKTMGGQPYELLSERIEREKREAVEAAVKRAIEEGREEGREELCLFMLRDGTLTEEQAAGFLGISLSTLHDKMKVSTFS